MLQQMISSLFVDFLLTTIVYKILQQVIGDDLKKDLEERKEWSKPAPWIKADKSKSCVLYKCSIRNSLEYRSLIFLIKLILCLVIST